MSSYRGGHIVRIKIKNFMTYDELEIFPKHGLNLVIGLNGSGKSSIMCAICLGLAGKPQFTGRSSQLSDFVKYGCNKATIEIELEQLSKRNVVITRIIQKEKSTWMINKTVVSLNEVQNAVKKFNIDVSNLCQFLPQEKVIEFSKMDKKQRLDNMLLAIGEPRLVNLFKELKQLKEDSVKLEDEKKKHQNLKERDEQVNVRLKVDVDKQEEKIRMKEHLRSLNLGKMVMLYNELKYVKLPEKKREKSLLQENLNKINEEFQTLTEDYDKQSSEINSMLEKMKEKKQSCSRKYESITKQETELSECHNKIQTAKISYQNKLEERHNQINKLKEIKTQLKALHELYNKYVAELPSLQEQDRITSHKLDEIKNQVSHLTSQKAYSHLEQNKLEYSLKETSYKIEKMKNEQNKKMEFLKQRFKDVYEAVVWLQQNNNMFKKPVHCPMLLLLKVPNDDNRKFIENFVSTRDLIAFICEDKEDNKRLTNILRTQKKLNVNIVMVPDKPIEYYNSPVISYELRKLGIKCFFKDIVEAPDAIMRFLCQCYRLHAIPLCVPEAEKNMNSILTQFKTFFTPDAKISGKHSKYGDRNMCIRKDPIKSRNFLPSSKDHSDQYQMLVAELEEEQNNFNALKSNITKLDDQIKEMERKENAIRVEKKSVIDKIKVIQNTRKQLEEKTKSHEKKQNELIDENQEKYKATTNVQGLNLQKRKICEKLGKMLQEFIKLKKEILKYNLKARFLRLKLESIKTRLSEKRNGVKIVEEKLNEARQACNEIVQEGKHLQSKLKQMLPSDAIEREECSNNHHMLEGKRKSYIIELNNFLDIEKPQFGIPKLIKKKLAEYGKHRSLEDIESDIRRLQAQIDLNCEGNDSVVMEYNERKKKIAETQKSIENYDRNLQKLQAEMTSKKDEWLPALQKHIRNINSKFSKYYKQLNCAGEIILDTCNNTDDFRKYGLQISLKYRDNEPFMELSNTHHSGGECSVAAIIFILSLQELTEVPFRCIDEINQGMDSQNERNIYSLIADSAKNGSCSQYFLLTPKLLVDLEMIEHVHVAVHVIYNSCFLEMKMDVQSHIDNAGND